MPGSQQEGSHGQLGEGQSPALAALHKKPDHTRQAQDGGATTGNP